MAVSFNNETVNKYKDLSDKIKENLTNEGNVVKEKEPHSAYYNNLPEGITKEQVEKLSKYNSRFVTAAHVAVGEMAAELFTKDKSLETVEAEIGFFGKNDTINMTVHREKVYQNHLAKDPSEQEIRKNLVIQTTVTTTSAKGYGVKAVREAMSEEFKNMFSK